MLLLLACVGQPVVLEDGDVRVHDTGPTPYDGPGLEDSEGETGGGETGDSAVDDTEVDTEGPVDTDTDTDTAEDSGDTDEAPIVCDPAWGDLSSTFDGYAMTEVYEPWGTLAIEGEGAVCAVSCSDSWARIMLCTGAGNDGLEPAELPAVMDGTLAVCVLLDPPDALAGPVSGTCTAETSSGTWTLAYDLDL